MIALQFEWGRDEQTCRKCSQLSSVSGRAERIAFLSGFQFGFRDNCEGQATFGLCLGASAVAAPPGQVRRGYRRLLLSQEVKWVKTRRLLGVCNVVNPNYLEDEMKRLLQLFMSAEKSKITWKILMQKSDSDSLLPFVKKKKTKGSCVLNSHTRQGISWLPLVTRPTINEFWYQFK